MSDSSSSNNSSIEEVVASGESAANNIKRHELLLLMLKTKKLMKDCGCKKVILDDSNTIKVELFDGNKYDLFITDDNDNDDENAKYAEDCIFEESDDNYEYDFSDDDGETSEKIDEFQPHRQLQQR